MKTVIYYFTGTGNSLVIARRLAENLEDAELIPITKGLKEGNPSTDADRIGLVFPVYFVDMPNPFKKFLAKLAFEKAHPYIFAVAHCGGEPGNVLRNLEGIIQAKGEKLAWSKVVLMPDNAIFFTPYPSRQLDRLEKVREEAERIASAVRQLKTETVGGRRKIVMPILSIGLAAAFRKGGGLNRKSCDEGRCNQCGICAKVCPVDNIRLIEGKVVWGDRCSECFACLQWCPNQAVRFGWLRAKELYHHPEVTVKDMMAQAGR